MRNLTTLLFLASSGFSNAETANDDVIYVQKLERQVIFPEHPGPEKIIDNNYLFGITFSDDSNKDQPISEDSTTSTVSTASTSKYVQDDSDSEENESDEKTSFASTQSSTDETKSSIAMPSELSSTQHSTGKTPEAETQSSGTKSSSTTTPTTTRTFSTSKKASTPPVKISELFASLEAGVEYNFGDVQVVTCSNFKTTPKMSTETIKMTTSLDSIPSGSFPTTSQKFTDSSSTSTISSTAKTAPFEKDKKTTSAQDSSSATTSTNSSSSSSVSSFTTPTTSFQSTSVPESSSTSSTPTSRTSEDKGRKSTTIVLTSTDSSTSKQITTSEAAPSTERSSTLSSTVPATLTDGEPSSTERRSMTTIPRQTTESSSISTSTRPSETTETTSTKFRTSKSSTSGTHSTPVHHLSSDSSHFSSSTTTSPTPSSSSLPTGSQKVTTEPTMSTEPPQSTKRSEPTQSSTDVVISTLSSTETFLDSTTQQSLTQTVTDNLQPAHSTEEIIPTATTTTEKITSAPEYEATEVVTSQSIASQPESEKTTTMITSSESTSSLMPSEPHSDSTTSTVSPTLLESTSSTSDDTTTFRPSSSVGNLIDSSTVDMSSESTAGVSNGFTLSTKIQESTTEARIPTLQDVETTIRVGQETDTALTTATSSITFAPTPSKKPSEATEYPPTAVSSTDSVRSTRETTPTGKTSSSSESQETISQNSDSTQSQSPSSDPSTSSRFSETSQSTGAPSSSSTSVPLSSPKTARTTLGIIDSTTAQPSTTTTRESKTRPETDSTTSEQESETTTEQESNETSFVTSPSTTDAPTLSDNTISTVRSATSSMTSPPTSASSKAATPPKTSSELVSETTTGQTSVESSVVTSPSTINAPTSSYSSTPPVSSFPPPATDSSSSITASATSAPSKPATSMKASQDKTSSTTQDPLCSEQCPTGYLIGSTYCYKLYHPSSRIKSYQAALAMCKTVDRQTLASFDQIQDNADIKLIQQSAAMKNIDWIFSNGIGGKQERLEKKASVYSIFAQSLVMHPIVKEVKVSAVSENISALCVLPQYCKSHICDVEKIFLAYNYYEDYVRNFDTLQPGETGDITCRYGSQQKFRITCNSLGAIYPSPSLIDCEGKEDKRKIIDTTNETVASCAFCFLRGTKDCLPVMDEEEGLMGYQCICTDDYHMAQCWRTQNPCNSNPKVCGPNGKCELKDRKMSCACEYGWTGDRCDQLMSEKFKRNMGYSATVGATITLGGLLFRILKIAIIGLSFSKQEDDPQDTHQNLRSYCMSAAGILMTLVSNPTVLGIDQPSCRFWFIAIHFFYLMAMAQWMWEGFNVSQVLRVVHANEWERDWLGDRPLGVRIAPRLVGSAVVLSTFLLLTFEKGWNQWAAPWTCVGVICEETLNSWIPLFAGVIFIGLFGAAAFELSRLVKSRRPLLGYMVDMKIERELGHEDGLCVQKCRKNDLMCLIGLGLLIFQWITVIISSDYRDDMFWGVVAVVAAGIYSAFCAFQEIMTCPEDLAKFTELLQRFAPDRFAPTYNETTMWSIYEVRQVFKLPKEKREAMMEGYLTSNQKLRLHHKWDLRLNHFLEEEGDARDDQNTISQAIQKVYVEEMRTIDESNATEDQKKSVQETNTEFIETIPKKVTPDAGELGGRLELVTLAAEDQIHGIRLAKFFIVPEFHTFQPEVPPRGQPYRRSNETAHERRLYKELEKEIYKIAREEARSQARFLNSAILFSQYGNDVAR